ncbi:cobalt-precorrin-6A reductase [Paramagnetospirillum marisnigri]|uniref:Cobalt-precorrin-6A reductase n=1 Tax=Paramagnetospirillum marisnigri TaxID=1285242 RepID=A0A178MD31_9PROT|nr:cobalt-precorrin-6A reductase [Paramagnetospirillum marisnigri]OAN46672.1 cobalt-precorrin-6A reductase [Paramagnetospirillum marisnigri]
MTRRILILGGTAEANALAQRLAGRPGLAVVVSLAGRTRAPRLPPGEVRIGGFGGPQGLEAFLRENAITAVIDATHPFAARMGLNAFQACQACTVPLLRLERPAWVAQAGDRWHEVEDWDEAIAALRDSARRVLLAVGRQEVALFAILERIWFLIRSVEAPEPLPAFAQAEAMLARGPFSVADEAALLQDRAIDTVVCKNSGGDDAKLVAARQLGLTVVMRRRPRRPETATVAGIEEALAWISGSGNHPPPAPGG